MGGRDGGVPSKATKATLELIGLLSGVLGTLRGRGRRSEHWADGPSNWQLDTRLRTHPGGTKQQPRAVPPGGVEFDWSVGGGGWRVTLSPTPSVELKAPPLFLARQLDPGQLGHSRLSRTGRYFRPCPENQRKRERFCSSIAKKEGGRSVFAKEEENLVSNQGNADLGRRNTLFCRSPKWRRAVSTVSCLSGAIARRGFQVSLPKQRRIEAFEEP